MLRIYSNITSMKNNDMENFLKKINIDCNLDLLKIALTHSSYCNQHQLPYKLCNERLEFLGDAVLKQEISSLLYTKFPNHNEGELSHIRSIVVSDETLEQIARKIELQNYLILGIGEEKTNGRNRPSNLACAFEAILGALFLDKKYDKITEFIKDLFSDEIDRINIEGLNVNPKALLQEYFQSISNITPEYKLTKQDGPPHNRIFYVDVFFENEFLASGVGHTKKMAQKVAAQNACQKLNLFKNKGV